MSVESIEAVNIKIEIELELVNEEPKCEATATVFIKQEPERVTAAEVKDEFQSALQFEIEGPSNNCEEERSNLAGENVSISNVTALPSTTIQPDHQENNKILSNDSHLFENDCTEKKTQTTDMDEIHCCDVCPRKFTHKHALNVHRKRHFNRKFSCDICNIRFGNEINLKAHITDIHRGKEEKQSYFKCGKCPKQFWSESHLTKHESTSTHKDSSDLSEEYSSNIAAPRADEPTQQVTQVRPPNKCPDCLKRFPDTAQLSAHTCAPEKPHICDVCSMKFKHKHTLNVHRSKHFNRIFACETCKVRFDNEIFLNAHFADFHTSEEKQAFQCAICLKQFRSKTFLSRHEATHHIKPGIR